MTWRRGAGAAGPPAAVAVAGAPADPSDCTLRRQMLLEEVVRLSL